MEKTTAFFDMDHTITWENSGLSFVRYARSHGMVDTRHLLKSVFKIVLYRMSLLNIEHWYEKNMELLSGTRLDDMERFCSQWFDETLKKAIFKEAFAIIQEHRRRGHRIVIISNSPVFFVRPMADLLEVTDIICTRVEIRDQVLTGRIIRPLCYGEGKMLYARRWSDEEGVNLRDCYFYTDSYFDIDLLRVVGHPFATNPDMKLRRAALQNNWPVLEFKKESAF